MTHKEKVNELIEGFLPFVDGLNMFESFDKSVADKKATECAIVCVEEIIKAITLFHNGADWQLKQTTTWEFWNAVLDELKNNKQ